MRDVLFSIHPIYADAILSGRKHVEVRRRYPLRETVGGTMFIYATKPIGAIIGTARIAGVEILGVDRLLERYGDAILIDKSALVNYLSPSQTAFAIRLEQPCRMPVPIEREQLLLRGITPPQAFMYLPRELSHSLPDAGFDDPRQMAFDFSESGSCVKAGCA
ncbi:ASCH domain-containing protein [Salinarimonas sp.]|uniref:ASCH domain-containing protein n=1 Tax=Salinarimonas sp. TaxID=2766526 RepID=UPI0032D979EF